MKIVPLTLAAAIVLSGCGDDAAPLGGDSTALSPARGGPPAKVTICHVDEDGERRTMEVPERAVDAHMAHGDATGPCADMCTPEPYVDPDGCSPALLQRTPDVVVTDLRAARDAGDWTAFACNYHPDAFVIDDQGVLIGRAEIVSWAQSFVDIFDGVTPTITDEVVFEDVVRNLFTLDGGWIVIPDGVNTYVIENGMVTRHSWHGIIEFTGPPPDGQ